jgi:hypothetical protein
MRKVLVLGLVLIGLGAVLVLLRHRSDSLEDDVPPPATPKVARTQPAPVPRPIVASDRSGASSAPESSQRESTPWTSESDLRAKGFATPRDAYESFLYAATGGDIPGTARAIYLTDDARRRAERVLASLPPEKRAEYGSPEQLIASLYVASSALMGKVPSGESSYQIVSDETGIGIDPMALGLAPSLASDPAYRTVRSKARSPSGGESDPIAVFVHTEDGWKWVMPPSMVDAFERLLKQPMRQR